MKLSSGTSTENIKGTSPGFIVFASDRAYNERVNPVIGFLALWRYLWEEGKMATGLVNQSRSSLHDSVQPDHLDLAGSDVDLTRSQESHGWLKDLSLLRLVPFAP